MVQPDTVVVELCSARTQILTMDEAELAKMSSEGAFTQLRNCIKLVSLIICFLAHLRFSVYQLKTKNLLINPNEMMV